MDKSRQQFEIMAVKRGLSTDKKKDCWGQEKYKYDMIQIMWEGWQASRESLEVELPDIGTNLLACNHEEFIDGFNDAISEIKNNINQQRSENKK